MQRFYILPYLDILMSRYGLHGFAARVVHIIDLAVMLLHGLAYRIKWETDRPGCRRVLVLIST